MYRWLEKWLPILMGCHCRPDLSFYFHGRKFPVCARCTGELVGIALLPAMWPFVHLSTVTALLLLAPLVVDGVVQLLTSYESRNLRRLWTGILFGYGLADLLFISLAATFRYGYETGLRFFS